MYEIKCQKEGGEYGKEGGVHKQNILYSNDSLDIIWNFDEEHEKTVHLVEITHHAILCRAMDLN